MDSVKKIYKYHRDREGKVYEWLKQLGVGGAEGLNAANGITLGRIFM